MTILADQGRFGVYHLVTIFLLSKLYLLLIAFVYASGILVSYSENTELFFIQFQNIPGILDKILLPVLKPFARWDSLYFLQIAKEGYNFEHQYAFLPLYPMLIRALTMLTKFINPLVSFPTRLLLCGVLISNVAHLLTALNVYRLGLLFGFDNNFSLISAILTIISPSFTFQSTIYSESLFSFLSTMGMVFFARRKFLLASIMWSLAGSTRSNGIVLVGFFLQQILYTTVLRFSITKLFSITRFLILGFISLMGFIVFQSFGYENFCSLPTPRPWCYDKLPNMYGFIQKVYWNVGPFEYYRRSQIPNFLIATPMIYISILTCYRYIKRRPIHFLSLGLIRDNNPDKQQGLPLILQDQLLGHHFLLLVMSIYALTFVHIQIIARLFSFMPLLYYSMTHMLREEGSMFSKNFILSYTLISVIIGPILFMGFLPPG